MSDHTAAPEAHDKALVVIAHHVNTVTALQPTGDGDSAPVLAFAVKLAGHLNRTGRSVEQTLVIPRDVLPSLLEIIAWYGTLADREFGHELIGAIEAGMEKTRTAS